MERVNILCLLGRAGHGKTTVANYLRDRYGAQVVSLAAALKKVAQKVMAFSDEQLYGAQEIKEAIDPRYGMSPRKFLQLLGTEGLREEFGHDVHVNNLLRQLEQHADRFDVFVVDDVRFPDEAESLGDPAGHAHGAVIKLICTDAPRRPGPEHASESSIDSVSDEAIAATVVSSHAQGLQHLYGQVEAALTTSIRLTRFRLLLRRPFPDPPKKITQDIAQGSVAHGGAR